MGGILAIERRISPFKLLVFGGFRGNPWNDGGPMGRTKGFTLIELMLVVAIIALLAAIAIPKFADLVIKAREAGVKEKLGTLRSAINLYYVDNEGTWPREVNLLGVPSVLVPKYLDEFPAISIPTVPSHALGSIHTGSLAGGDPYVTDFLWFGAVQGWAYGWRTGTLVVNCTHTDSKGSTWSLW
jgi:prepilin-type N-terminal cleavage/methylation domain-containing protein